MPYHTKIADKGVNLCPLFKNHSIFAFSAPQNIQDVGVLIVVHPNVEGLLQRHHTRSQLSVQLPVFLEQLCLVKVDRRLLPAAHPVDPAGHMNA